MIDKTLIDWPDPEIDPEDMCFNGGHVWYESENDGIYQVLKCRNCGKLSIGWFKHDK